MGDAVRRVRGHLQVLARENWTALEDQHACNVSWLQSELAQIARSLKVRARFDARPPIAPAPYPSALGDTGKATEPSNKKQKTDTHREQPAAPLDIPKTMSTRLSMQLRTRAVSVDVTRKERKTRKRARPSEMLLKDPAKLKVVELRYELKLRGLSTRGLKAALINRLLDALEEDQSENRRHVVEENKQIVVTDDEDDDIVRESVGSYKSPRRQSTSPKAAAKDDEKEVGDAKKMNTEGSDIVPQTSAIAARNRSGEVCTNTDQSTSVNAGGTDSIPTDQLRGNDKESDDPSARRDVKEAAAARSQDGKTCDDRETRKSIQEHELTSSLLAWKRKSILRKATSLAPRATRKVSFATKKMVNGIVESSQTDTTQPEPSPDDAPSCTDKGIEASIGDETHETSFDSVSKDAAKVLTVSSPGATVTALQTREESPIPIVVENAIDEQQRTQEYKESVQREAQKLRADAKLSAQKRLEEAKASKAFWAKRDQLKAKLRASSSDKQKSVLMSKALTENPVSPSFSTAADSTSSSTNDQTASASEKEKQTQPTAEITQKDQEKANDFMQSMARQQQVASISDVSFFVESSHNEDKGIRSTYSAVEDKQHVERIMSARVSEKTAANSMPLTVQRTKDSLLPMSDGISSRQEWPRLKRESLALSPIPKDVESEKEIKLPMIEPLRTWNRSDSLSSTVSSIPEPLLVENALKSGAAMALTNPHRPMSHLGNELHSFSSVLDQDTLQQSNSSRLAPVVNALKLAEKSRVAEEKKRLEKEKRKAIVKKKMEEHKLAIALKEKAEKDAQAKREQDRLNERKKREAELAKRRQQKLKEMRAGLEKKRAMLAAEKKSRFASSVTTSLKAAPSATAIPHHKQRGLASASEVSQAFTKPTCKPLHKAISKPVSKPHCSQPLVKSHSSQLGPVVAKSVPPKHGSKPPVVSSVPAKQAPKSHSPELVDYDMSDNMKSSNGGSSDSDAGHRGSKKVPRWAQRDHLNRILHAQFGQHAIDPSPGIFQDFVDTCNLEAIFETSDVQKKKKFARRTSSGNWLADCPTARDKALYQRDMGYDQ